MTRPHRPLFARLFSGGWSSLLTLILSLSLLLGSPLARGEEKPAEKPKVDAPEPKQPEKEEPKKEEAPKAAPKEEPKVEPKKEEPKKEDTKKDEKKPEADPKKTDKAKPPEGGTSSLPSVKDAAWTKTSPQTVQDLQAIEERVQQVVARAEKWTVGLIVGQARGSGVIISKEGYVLTAGHVSAIPDRPVQIILHNGKVVRGRSLGRNSAIDSGLIKIDEGEDWDHADMGESGKLKQGDWCIAMGHPGGWQRGRSAVVRLGRIISVGERTVTTDATLVGGDSGGPLFDMDGHVIAIHSRIAAPTTANFHVPVDTYRGTWDRLAAGEDYSDRPVLTPPAVAAFTGENDPKGIRITATTEGGPAALAGLKVGDIVRRLDDSRVRTCNDLIDALNRKKPTDAVVFEVLREDKTTKVSVILAAGFDKAKPFLGISGQDHAKGVSIESVVIGTPADAAKLVKGDVVTSFKGEALKDLATLQGIVAKMKAGESADMEVVRGSETLKLKITLGMKG